MSNTKIKKVVIKVIVTMSILIALEFILLSNWSTNGSKIVVKRNAKINIVTTDDMYGHIIVKKLNEITITINL